VADLSDFSLADPRANQVLQKVREELVVTTPFRTLAQPVAIVFPAAGVSVEVQHLLREIPDGYLLLNADCAVKRTPGKQWTKELAYLVSDTANATAILAFGVFRQGVTSVVAQ
jgi:hypothetical protein